MACGSAAASRPVVIRTANANLMRSSISFYLPARSQKQAFRTAWSTKSSSTHPPPLLPDSYRWDRRRACPNTLASPTGPNLALDRGRRRRPALRGSGCRCYSLGLSTTVRSSNSSSVLRTCCFFHSNVMSLVLTSTSLNWPMVSPGFISWKRSCAHTEDRGGHSVQVHGAVILRQRRHRLRRRRRRRRFHRSMSGLRVGCNSSFCATCCIRWPARGLRRQSGSGEGGGSVALAAAHLGVRAPARPDTGCATAIRPRSRARPAARSTHQFAVHRPPPLFSRAIFLLTTPESPSRTCSIFSLAVEPVI